MADGCDQVARQARCIKGLGPAMLEIEGLPLAFRLLNAETGMRPPAAVHKYTGRSVFIGDEIDVERRLCRGTKKPRAVMLCNPVKRKPYDLTQETPPAPAVCIASSHSNRHRCNRHSDVQISMALILGQDARAGKRQNACPASKLTKTALFTIAFAGFRRARM